MCLENSGSGMLQSPVKEDAEKEARGPDAIGPGHRHLSPAGPLSSSCKPSPRPPRASTLQSHSLPNILRPADSSKGRSHQLHLQWNLRYLSCRSYLEDQSTGCRVALWCLSWSLTSPAGSVLLSGTLHSSLGRAVLTLSRRPVTLCGCCWLRHSLGI